MILSTIVYLAYAQTPNTSPLSEALMNFAVTFLSFGSVWLMIQMKNLQKLKTQEMPKVQESVPSLDDTLPLALSGNMNEVIISLHHCQEQYERLQLRYEESLSVISRQQETIMELTLNQITVQNRLYQVEKQLLENKQSLEPSG